MTTVTCNSPSSHGISSFTVVDVWELLMGFFHSLQRVFRTFYMVRMNSDHSKGEPVLKNNSTQDHQDVCT